jgi:hypothetical protein
MEDFVHALKEMLSVRVFGVEGRDIHRHDIPFPIPAELAPSPVSAPVPLPAPVSAPEPAPGAWSTIDEESDTDV